MKRGRKITVPPEDRRLALVRRSTVLSPLKFMTLTENLNNLADHFAITLGVAVDAPLTLSDSIPSATDSLTSFLGVAVESGDQFLFLDGFEMNRDTGLEASDSFTLTDSISLGQGLTFDESFTLTDARDLNLHHLTELSDTIILTDDLALGSGLAAEDAFTLTDYLEVGVSQGLGDSLSLSDGLTVRLGYSVPLTDAIPAQSDAISLGYGLAPSDQIVMADSFATFGQYFLTIQETIHNWDEFLIAIPFGVNFSFERFDSFTLEDSITLFSTGAKAFADSFTLSDAATLRGNGLLTFADQFTLADAATRIIDCRIIVSDNAANLNDSMTMRGNGLLSTAESINNLADAYTARGHGTLSFSEQLTQTDGFAKFGTGSKAFADSAIQPADGTARAGPIWDIAVTGQQLTQTDAIALNLDGSIRQVVATDSFTLTDSFVSKRGPTRWNDAIVVSTTAESALTQNLSDSLPAMTDAQVNKFIRWRDSISVVKTNADVLSVAVGDTLPAMADALSSARVQFAAPTSDITVGLWSATPLWQKIDESVASDADLIVSATNPSNDTSEVLLNTGLTDPISSTNHVLSYRYKKSANAGRQIDLTVRLIQGTSILATFTHTAIGGTIVQADQTLTGTQADSITNYGDLRIRFTANAVGSGTGRAGQITWVQFRCPK